MKDIQSEKEKIIEQLSLVNDIKVLYKIKNLLNSSLQKEKVLDSFVYQKEKDSVHERIAAYKEKPENVLTWNDIENKINLG